MKAQRHKVGKDETNDPRGWWKADSYFTPLIDIFTQTEI